MDDIHYEIEKSACIKSLEDAISEIRTIEYRLSEQGYSELRRDITRKHDNAIRIACMNLIKRIRLS